jgi:hypothetical protein
MSTVLQPVGPHEPRVYWMRRALVIVPILIVILIIAVSCGGGGGGGGGKKNSSGKHPATHVTTSASSSSTPTASASAAAACDPSKLTLTLTTDAVHDSYNVGQTPKFTGTFKNPGTSPCSFTFAPTHENWTVESGPAQIWTTSGCTTSQAVKAVTIKAGGHKKVSVTWDGRVQGSKCAVGDPAAAGEYTLGASLDGVTAAKKAVFHITNSGA